MGSQLLRDLFVCHVPIQGNCWRDREENMGDNIPSLYHLLWLCHLLSPRKDEGPSIYFFFLHTSFSIHKIPAQLVIFSGASLALSWPFKLLHAWDQSLWFWNTLLHPSILPGETVQNNWRELIQTSQTDVGERFPPTQSSSDWNLAFLYHRWPFPFVKHVNLLFKHVPFS